MVPSEKMFYRLFLALWPDDVGRQAMAKHTQFWAWPEQSVRYEPVDWHVTLHFLGNLPEQRLPELSAGLHVPFDHFNLVLDRPERWPHGLAVLGASTVPNELLDLHLRLTRAITVLDLPVEHRLYRPHVTLARAAQAAVPPQSFAPVVWSIREYVLALSAGRPEKRYQVIGRYPHGKRDQCRRDRGDT
jgi:RNA 2',3'-cyclic 3'-phosphodiesterase